MVRKPLIDLLEGVSIFVCPVRSVSSGRESTRGDESIKWIVRAPQSCVGLTILSKGSMLLVRKTSKVTRSITFLQPIDRHHSNHSNWIFVDLEHMCIALNDSLYAQNCPRFVVKVHANYLHVEFPSLSFTNIPFVDIKKGR